MPYVGDDVHRATKRKWDHDGNEAFRFSHPASGAAVFHVLNQQAAPESADGISARKTLPPTKRFRTIHDDNDVHTHGHGDIHSSHRRGASRELATASQGIHAGSGNKVPVKINGTVLMPCHVCHRRPTKKSDLDSFARCQSCQEQTCFVCIRECQGRNSKITTAPFLAEDEEVLSRSFHMDDVDECTTLPIPNTNTQQRNNDTNEQEGMASRRAADSSIHHTMICSRCCVEKGAEGEVVCLGCLSDMDTA